MAVNSISYDYKPPIAVWIVNVETQAIFHGTCIEVKIKVYKTSSIVTNLRYSVLLDNGKGTIDVSDDNIFDTYDSAEQYLYSILNPNVNITPTLTPTPSSSRNIIPTNLLYNSLIAYWSLDELSGTRNDSISGIKLYDLNNNIFTADTPIQGNAVYKQTPYNIFDGLSTNSSNLLNPSQSFSITAWMQSPDVANNITSLGKYNEFTQKGYSINIIFDENIAEHRIYSQIGDGEHSHTLICDSGEELPTHWHFIVFTYDINTNAVTLWVNRETNSHTSEILNSDNTRFMLFAKGFDEINDIPFSSSSLGSKIDEVGFYSRILTNDEIEFLYNDGDGVPLSAIEGFISQITPTPTPTSTATPTVTVTSTATPTVTATITPTPSLYSSPTPTPTITPTISLTPTQTPTQTGTPTVTPTQTATVTPTTTPAPSVTPSSSAGSLYSIWSSTQKGPDVILTESNTIATISTVSVWNNVQGNIRKSTGKWYYEYQVIASGNLSAVGVCLNNFNINQDFGSAKSWGVRFDGYTVGNGVSVYNNILAAGTSNAPFVIGVAFDLNIGNIWFSINGTWITGDPALGISPTFSGLLGGFYPLAGALTSDTASILIKSHFLTYNTPNTFIPGWYA